MVTYNRFAEPHGVTWFMRENNIRKEDVIEIVYDSYTHEFILFWEI